MNKSINDYIQENLYRKQLFNTRNISYTINNYNEQNDDYKNNNYLIDYIALGCMILSFLILFCLHLFLNKYYPMKIKRFLIFIKQKCYCCYINNNDNHDNLDIESNTSNDNDYFQYSYNENIIDVNNIINNLQIVISVNDSDKENDKDSICSICLNNINKTDSDIIYLNCCKQKFCKNPCLEGWIKQKLHSNENPSCPLCRTPLIKF